MGAEPTAPPGDVGQRRGGKAWCVKVPTRFQSWLNGVGTFVVAFPSAVRTEPSVQRGV